MKAALKAKPICLFTSSGPLNETHDFNFCGNNIVLAFREILATAVTS